jgi:CoA:oxalate CoA-transferase
MNWPLEGILVVDFSQFLAGPYASLRLLDLGARVIKVENIEGGDLCRYHYLSETRIDGDSTLFHAINRGKESIALDLKTAEGLARAQKLVARADVVIQNFRPGVMERLGLDYAAVQGLNPDVIYGSISGYGTAGDWADLPGQDLLAQARSGVMWLSGNAGDGPVPIGLPIADISTGSNLAMGILGALFRHARTGQGSLVQTSLLESMVEMQFEFLTTYLNNGQTAPQRLASGSAHGYLGAPYGVYPTAQGHLALAMSSLLALGQAFESAEICTLAAQPEAGFVQREALHRLIGENLRARPAAEWETLLTAKGIWCARVLTWPELLQSESFAALDLLATPTASPMQFLRAPLRLDGQRPEISTPGPKLNADGARVAEEID